MLVSVVTAVYNGEKYLQECIQSILNQTYPEFEYIIVNDGSTDGTKEILDAVQDTRVRIIHLDQNCGAAFCLNQGIDQAKGKWIAIQDADDISAPTRLEEQVSYLKSHPQAIGVSSFVKGIEGEESVSKEFLHAHESAFNRVLSEEEVYKSRFCICYVCHGSVMFSKDAFYRVGGYNQLFKIVYDRDLWFRLFEIAPFEKIPKELYYYRVLPHSLSHGNSFVLGKELLLAVTMGIRDVICRNKGYLHGEDPNVIVIASRNKCEFFKVNIAPYVNMNVQRYINHSRELRNWELKRLLDKELIDGIFVLDDNQSHNFMKKLIYKGLRMDKHIFFLKIE
ncbi:glycosyltransferase family 2 protein [Ectobacillus funiculus]|uniref:Glycosyltransferase family 2 protein n=1 Tax=Ectobacillus funiculus TaxID=137993 RepID=A0ABV5WR65_9BACI